MDRLFLDKNDESDDIDIVFDKNEDNTNKKFSNRDIILVN